MLPPDGSASGGADECCHDESRLGVPVLTFIVRVVPVSESLSGGTFPYGGIVSFFLEVIRFIRGTFYALPHENRLIVADDKGMSDKMVSRDTID